MAELDRIPEDERASGVVTKHTNLVGHLRGAWSEVTPVNAKEFKLRFGGLLRLGWMPAVCCGLAERRISIGRAHAMRSHDGSWMAEFFVQPLEGAERPTSIPLLKLAEGTDAMCTDSLHVDNYDLSQSEDHGGTLKLVVNAPDYLGLLGALLASFARCDLAPLEMHIETTQDAAHDTFWLETRAGEDSAAARAKLEAIFTRGARAL